MKSARFALSLCPALLLALAPIALAGGDGSVSLFSGKDLSGWEGAEGYWSVKDGAITGTTTKETLLKNNTFLVWRGGLVGDFDLTLKYRIEGGNSGVQYRSKVLDEKKFIVGGYQADIDSSGRYTGIMYEERARGILAERGQKVTIGTDGKKQVEKFGDAAELGKKVSPKGWNDYRVVARGNRLRHFVNGVLMSEIVDNQEGKSAARGVLALQLHQGPPMVVQFKDLRLHTVR